MESQEVAIPNQRFCQYPQEVILQFERPSLVSTLSLISHEYLISKRIEVHLKLVDPELVDQQKIDFVLNPTQINFKKLGYINLNSNESSNYEVREMKTLSLDNYCTHIKLVLWHNFPNDLNIFSQVGLTSISAKGKLMIEAIKRPISSSKDPQNAQGGTDEADGRQSHSSRQSSEVSGHRKALDEQLQQLEAYLDPDVKFRLRALDEARRRAEQQEDYSEAKMIYHAYQNLITVCIQLVKLEERKQIAVQNYDYDNAEMIKWVIMAN